MTTAMEVDRRCVACGKVLLRKRWAQGQPEARRDWAVRRFCNRACYYRWRRQHHTRRAVAEVMGPPKPAADTELGLMSPFTVGALAARVIKSKADQVEFQRGWQAAKKAHTVS